MSSHDLDPFEYSRFYSYSTCRRQNELCKYTNFGPVETRLGGSRFRMVKCFIRYSRLVLVRMDYIIRLATGNLLYNRKSVKWNLPRRNTHGTQLYTSNSPRASSPYCTKAVRVGDVNAFNEIGVNSTQYAIRYIVNFNVKLTNVGVWSNFRCERRMSMTSQYYFDDITSLVIFFTRGCTKVKTSTQWSLWYEPEIIKQRGFDSRHGLLMDREKIFALSWTNCEYIINNSVL